MSSCVLLRRQQQQERVASLCRQDLFFSYGGRTCSLKVRLKSKVDSKNGFSWDSSFYKLKNDEDMRGLCDPLWWSWRLSVSNFGARGRPSRFLTKTKLDSSKYKNPSFGPYPLGRQSSSRWEAACACLTMKAAFVCGVVICQVENKPREWCAAANEDEFEMDSAKCGGFWNGFSKMSMSLKWIQQMRRNLKRI